MTPTRPCLDAETLAAWVDGGLSRSDAAMAEAHVSSCPRCQAIAGLVVKTTPATIAGAPWWRARAAWLVPVTAAVAAVGLWIITPANLTRGPEPPATMARLEPPPSAVAPASVPSAPAGAPAAAARESAPKQSGERQELKQQEKASDARVRDLAKDETPRLRAETTKKKEREADNSAAAETAVGRLTAPSAAPAEAKAAVSTDGALRWRITERGALERSTDGGSQWDAVEVGVTATFTTVRAPEPRTALVTTTDGRVFRTDDGGKTWRPVSK